MSQEDDLNSLLELHQRRLQILKRQAAIAGRNADPAILIEIEDIEAEVAALKGQLGLAAEAQPAPPPLRPATVAQAEPAAPVVAQARIGLPLELVEEFEKGNVVLFCGEGISSGPGRLLSRAELAQALAQEIGLADSQARSLAEVAQLYEADRGRQRLVAKIEQLVRAGPLARPLETHHLLATLPGKRIVTVTWDEWLEEALRQAGRPFVRVSRDSEVAFIDDSQLLLVKLHGTLSDRTSLVLTGDDQQSLLTRSPELANLVQGFLAQRTVLFLGFNLADLDFKQMYNQVVDRLGQMKRRAYAVQPAVDPWLAKDWTRKNVELIAADLVAFLATLKDLG